MFLSAEAQAPRKLIDSPWLWVLLFSVAAVIFLIGIAPKYAQRQSRLELQYHARQEIARRQVAGEAPRSADNALAVAPPEPGEMIIGLRPLIATFAALAALSALLLWRGVLGRDGRRRDGRPGSPPQTPAGTA